MNPTPQQENIFSFISEEEKNLMVIAGPGCGKTSTSVQAGEFIPSSKRTCFLAFNKSIADSLRSKLPSHVHASTFNSLGFKIMRDYHQSRTDPKKMGTILKDSLSLSPKNKEFHDIIKLISSTRASFPLASKDPSPSLLWETARIYDISLEEHNIRKAKQAMEISLKNPSIVDFDEQVLFPVLKKLPPMEDFDVIFVDEVQDLSPLQIEFVKLLAGKKGRVVLVGDPHQAIYGFRGADPEGIDKMVDSFSCHTLPLSVSFRCSQEVAALARNFNPELSAAEGNMEGNTGACPLPSQNQFTQEDMILCSANAPLFKLGRAFLKENLPCRLWSSLLPQMEGFIKSFKKNRVEELKKALDNWLEAEKQRLYEEDKLHLIPSRIDKYETVLAIIPEGATQVSAVVQNLRELGESSQGPVISTIHKAKGTEAQRVFLLSKELPPWLLDNLAPWEERQRENMDYVAITRAEEEFYRVPEEDWKEKLE